MPSSMWTTLVCSGANRSPSGASTAATSWRSSSAYSPDTIRTKVICLCRARNKQMSFQLPSPWLLRFWRCPVGIRGGRCKNPGRAQIRKWPAECTCPPLQPQA